jgi:hypothetical protein
MDIDSVIDDGEIDEFTSMQPYMRGAPLSPEVRNKLENPPARSEYISNLSATKTGFQVNNIYKDFEYKKENLLEILHAQSKAGASEFRVRTKGKFIDHLA